MNKFLKYATVSVLVMTIGLSLSANSNMPADPTINQKDKEINWKSFEVAAEMENTSRKYFIFVTTDWCGWCTRMKNTTFKNEEVIKLLNEEFIPVMFNAETKETITFRGEDYKFINQGRRGVHELAAALLNNQLSYPSVVFLDEEMNMIQPLPGYKGPEDLRIILKFLADEIYEEMDFQEYYNQQTDQGE